MADHATWVSFENDELKLLLSYLEDAKQLTENECAAVAATIRKFTGEGAKDPVFRDAAEDLNFVRAGECEIDDHAVVSASDEGAYVMAWVWVSNEAAGIEPEDDDADYDDDGNLRAGVDN